MTIQGPEPAGFVVTLKDVYQEMQAGFGQLRQIGGQLTAMQEWQRDTNQHRNDLEARVRLLESAKARMWGGLALLSALFIGGGVWAGLILSSR